MKIRSLSIISFTMMLITTSMACGLSTPIPPQNESNNPSTGTEPTIASGGGAADGIVFAGKVVNPNTGEWTKNRLVLLFLQSKEIARSITPTGEYDATILPGQQERLDGGLGVIDGLFIIRIPNTYELNLGNLGIPVSEVPFDWIYDSDIGGWYHPYGLAAWIDPFYEGNSRDFYIPSKNIHYTLMVLPGDISQLPAEIQQSGSLSLLDGNRLVAIDPNAPAPAPQPAFSNNLADFQLVTEDIQEFPPAIFPINNCGGTADVIQEITHTYIHEIIDESKQKLGIELPILDWLTINAETERHYGISDKEVTTYSTTLTVPAGQNIQYTVIRRQTWETGVAVITSNGIQISASYRILKNETFEVADSEQKPCQ